MPIKVRCGDCKAVLNVSDKAAGRVVLCKNCGGKVRVPAAPAEGAPTELMATEEPDETAPRGPARKKSARRAETQPAPAHAEENIFGGLSFDRVEDTKRRVCPGCAKPVHLDDIECPKCGVTIATGTLSERQRIRLARKGPPPEEFYRDVWGNAWKFLKLHKAYAVSTAIVWSTTLSMAVSCFYAYNWYVRTRTAELLESAKADPNVVIEGSRLIITVKEGEKARYDNKLYTNKGTYVLSHPGIASMREPPAIFWAGMTIVFQLGFGGWGWMLAVKIAELTMSGQKKIKRFQVDFFGNLTMGFRFYFWPVVVMIPFAWIGPLLLGVGQPLAAGIVNVVVALLPMLLFLPAAVVHMTQRYGYRAWLINWMTLDFCKTIGASLYIAAMSVFLVLLIPGAAIGTAIAMQNRLVPWIQSQHANALAWLAGNVQDMGTGSFRFLFYEMPIVFTACFVVFGVIFSLIAGQAVFMMRVIGLYGVYFRPDLSLVTEFADRTPAGFGPRFLAYLVDSILLSVLCIPAALIGWVSGFLFSTYGLEARTQEMLQLVATGVATLGIWAFYFATAESGQARATMGKWSLGLLVLCEDDKPMTRKQAFRRVACAFLTPLTLYIGFIMTAFRKDHHALHDLMSKTKVVWRGEELS